MATYSNFYLTNSGRNLLNDLITGNGELEFRSLAVGAGIYSDEEKKTDYLRNKDSLLDERQRFPFSGIENEKTGFVRLKAGIDNTELEEGYLLTETCVYAGKKGEAAEVLYCISLAETPDYIPAFSSGQPFSMIFNLTIGVLDTDKVTISYNPNAYALAEDLKRVSDKVGECDISGIGNGTVTGALSALNSSLNGLGGNIRYNIETDMVQIFDGTEWVDWKNGIRYPENYKEKIFTKDASVNSTLTLQTLSNNAILSSYDAHYEELRTGIKLRLTETSYSSDYFFVTALTNIYYSTNENMYNKKTLATGTKISWKWDSTVTYYFMEI